MRAPPCRSLWGRYVETQIAQQLDWSSPQEWRVLMSVAIKTLMALGMRSGPPRRATCSGDHFSISEQNRHTAGRRVA